MCFAGTIFAQNPSAATAETNNQNPSQINTQKSASPSAAYHQQSSSSIMKRKDAMIKKHGSLDNALAAKARNQDAAKKSNPLPAPKAD